MNNYQIGRIGEQAVVSYLDRINCIVVEQNYRNRFGEIDVIFLDEDILVFGEVKTRTSKNFGGPREAVDKRKLNRIIKVSQEYIKKHSVINVNIRFDVFEVFFYERKINHIKNVDIGGDIV